MDPRLIAAAKSGDVESLHGLLIKDPFLLNRVALFRADTPLHIGSMCGHLPFVQEILKQKKEFAYFVNIDGFTPLHLASANGHLQIVEELLNIDRSLCSIQGKEKWLALHCAASKGRIDVMKTLLSACPNSVGLKTAQGKTVLHLAIMNNEFQAFEFLVEQVRKLKNKKQILNEKDTGGNTILHWAAAKNQYLVIYLLLVEDDVTKLHMKINSRNNNRKTPLDVAASKSVTRILVNAGAKRAKDLPHVVIPIPNSDQSTASNNEVQAQCSNLECMGYLYVVFIVIFCSFRYFFLKHL